MTNAELLYIAQRQSAEDTGCLPEDYLADAREIFPNTWTAHDGETVTMRYPNGEENAWISLC